MPLSKKPVPESDHRGTEGGKVLPHFREASPRLSRHLLAPAQVAGLDGDGPNAREGQRGATTISSFSEEALREFEVRNRALAVPEPECGGAQHIRRLRSFR